MLLELTVLIHTHIFIYCVADAVHTYVKSKSLCFVCSGRKSSNVLQKCMTAVVDNKNQNIGVFVAKCGEYSATV